MFIKKNTTFTDTYFVYIDRKKILLPLFTNIDIRIYVMVLFLLQFVL